MTAPNAAGLTERQQRNVLRRVRFGDGCWEWAGRMNVWGYGTMHIGKHTRQAHRVVYEILVGLVPEGLELDHLCRVKSCVRPSHMEPVTHGENVRRSYRDRAYRIFHRGVLVVDKPERVGMPA